MSRYLTMALGILVASAVAPASGQTIQLPTTRVFSVQTSVLVPDRGSAVLGGVGRSASGGVTGSSGWSGIPGAGRLFANRSTGTERGSAMASVSATIIDLDAMDRAILQGREADRTMRRNEGIAAKAAFLNQHMQRNPLTRTDSQPASGGRSAAVSWRARPR